MAVDLTKKSGAELDTLIANYRKANQLDHPILREALRLRGKLGSKTLDLKRSCAAIIAAAKAGRFVSYKQIADASGCDWISAYPVISAHLYLVLKQARANGWPPLSAIVVNGEHVETGEMKPETLAGFIGAVAGVGYEIEADPEMSLSLMQRQVFTWAKGYQGP